MRRILNRLALALAVLLLALLPLHAFGFTWLRSFYWTDSWPVFVQIWKEMLVAGLCLLALPGFFAEPRRLLARHNWPALGLIILSVLYFVFSGDAGQAAFGARALLLFFIVFLAVQFIPWRKADFSRLAAVFAAAAGAVSAFGLIQYFLLPRDFLREFGYSEVVSTWLPGGNLPMYHLVSGTDLVRLQATFAGPNQLAAWLAVAVPVLFWLRSKTQNAAARFALAAAAGASLVCIGLTFSRSAWLGVLAAGGVWLACELATRLGRGRLILAGVSAVGALFGLGLAASQLWPDAAHVLVRTASSSERWQRLTLASEIVLENPFGLGLGASSGASQRFDSGDHAGLTPENTFVQYALELGWLGGALFLLALARIALQLRRHESPVFYSLIALAVIMLFLHPLEDSPTAITAGLLAGVAVSRRV